MAAMVDFNALPLLALKRRFRGEDISWNRNQPGSRPDFGESNCNREATVCGNRGACNWCEYPGAIRDRVEFCPVLAVPAPMRCETATAVRVSAACLQVGRSEEHTSELQSLRHLVCRLLL